MLALTISCLFVHSLIDTVFCTLNKFVTTLHPNAQLAEGVGQLLFEVCKGVPKQFHSCTEKLFPLLLSQLGSPQYSPSAVFQTLTKLVQLMAEHTRAQFSAPVWTPLLVSIYNYRVTSALSLVYTVTDTVNVYNCTHS